MTAYYNEFDPYAAEWLRNLIAAGHIAPGDVDTRSITEVQPDELAGYTQCHFFAGIGGWSYALRLAGWADDAPVWTGSCPCQPFSCAGKGLGTADARHLWPQFRRLIRGCRPSVVFGEQVESKDGRRWLSGVRSDLEGMGYRVGAADLCAAGVAAPQRRQRLYWVADSVEDGRGERQRYIPSRECSSEGGGVTDSLADSERDGRRRDESDRVTQERTVNRGSGTGVDAVALGDSVNAGSQRFRGDGDDGDQPERHDANADGSIAATGVWDQYRIVYCRDGKYRRIPLPESGVFPLAYGIPRRVGQLRSGIDAMGLRAARSCRTGRLKGYGNAIVPQLTAEFIRACNV